MTIEYPKRWEPLLNYQWFLQRTDLYVLIEELQDILSEHFSNVSISKQRIEENEKEKYNTFIFYMRRGYPIDKNDDTVLVSMFSCYIVLSDIYLNTESRTYNIIVKTHGDTISWNEFRVNERLEVFRGIVADIQEYEGSQD